jgi:hypothetical protein
MKKSILTAMVAFLGAQLVHAGELYCGANIEQTPGSQVYNKLVFWEKAEAGKSIARYLLADGTIIRGESLTQDELARITDGTLVIGTSTLDGEVSVFSARVKKDSSDQLKFDNLSLATSLENGTPILVANGIAVACKEM